MKKIIFIFLICFFPALTWGAAYYVDPTAQYNGGSPLAGTMGNCTSPYDTPAKSCDIRTVFLYARTNATEAVDLRILAGTVDLTEPNLSYYLWSVAYDLTIQGHDGTSELTSSDVIIYGGGTNAFLTSNNAGTNLVVKNITFQNMVESASDTKCTVIRTNNTASVLIDGCVFLGNVNNHAVNANGPALHATSTGGDVSIIDTEFLNNIASDGVNTGFGGAIYLFAVGGDVLLSNVTGTGNTALLQGGFGYFSASISGGITVDSDCSFSNNTASDGSVNGLGGVFSIGNTTRPVTISGDYTDNQAWSAGGGINISNTGTNLVQDATFTRNKVIGTDAGNHQGGGIKVSESGVVLIIENSIFAYNDAGDFNGANSAGGGVKFSNGASGIVRWSILKYNVANEGAGIDFGGSDAVTSFIQYCLFIYNEADSDDGGAGLGGAWESINSHSVNAYNNTYYGNVADIFGDNVYINSAATPNESTITLKNEIHRSGGTDEIYGDSDTILSVTYSNIQGGAAAVTGEDTYVDNINSDPLFSSDYYLSDDSPSKRTGIAIAGFHDTADGQRDVAGNFVAPYEINMGAYGNLRSASVGIILGGIW